MVFHVELLLRVGSELRVVSEIGSVGQEQPMTFEWLEPGDYVLRVQVHSDLTISHPVPSWDGTKDLGTVEIEMPD